MHGTDVPLIFHNPDLWPLTAGAEGRPVMADRMADAFIAFAKTGNPSTPALPWPAYDARTKPTMVFDSQSGAKNDPDRDCWRCCLPGRAGGRPRPAGGAGQIRN